MRMPLLAALGALCCAGCQPPAPPLPPPTEQAPAPETPANVEPAPEAYVAPVVWDRLEPGPHFVGYRAEVRTDPARVVLNPDLNAEQTWVARPVVRAVWYPAAPTGAARLKVGEYFVTPPTEHTGFAKLLDAHLRGTVAEEYFGGDMPGSITARLMDEEQKKFVAETMALEAGAVRDAAPAEGSFPVVVYHPGFGGAYADVFGLAEYLASHGYVVVSSAYQVDDGVDMAIGDTHHSFLELDYLLNSLADLEMADPEHVVIAGHSFGAHNASFNGMHNRRFEAIVSLDSTIANREKRDYSGHFSERARIRVPYLALRSNWGKYTHFEDEVPLADRHVINIDQAKHAEFEGLGGLLSVRSGREDRDVRRGLFVIRKVREFLDYVVKGDAQAAERLADMKAEGVTAVYRHQAAEDPRRFLGPDLARAIVADPAGWVALCPEMEACADPLETALLILSEAGHAGAAKDALALARKRVPDSWRFLRMRASLEAFAGERDAVVATLNEVIEKLEADKSLTGRTRDYFIYTTKSLREAAGGPPAFPE